VNRGDQLGYALEQGIPFMILFGDYELQQGVVKVRVLLCGGGGGMGVFGLGFDRRTLHGGGGVVSVVNGKGGLGVVG
jgi:hypothetical protein